MKKFLYICIGVAVCLATLYACVKDPTTDANQSNNPNAFLTVEEAQAFFEESFASDTRSSSESSTSKFFDPGDYTPLWSDALTSENSSLGSVDVPILASRKYRAIRSEFKNGCASAYIVEMTQKMVVVKSKTNDDKAQYLLTLIPDRDYYAKNKGDISSKFLNSGDKGRYSGYALYTYNGFPVRLNKYRDGEKTEGVTIIGITDSVELFKRFSVIHKKIGEMQIQYQNVAILTRGGGENEWQTDDDWWYQNGTFFIDNDGNIFIDNDGDGIPDSVWIPPVIVDPDSESDNNGDSPYRYLGLVLRHLLLRGCR